MALDLSYSASSRRLVLPGKSFGASAEEFAGPPKEGRKLREFLKANEELRLVVERSGSDDMTLDEPGFLSMLRDRPSITLSSSGCRTHASLCRMWTAAMG